MMVEIMTVRTVEGSEAHQVRMMMVMAEIFISLNLLARMAAPIQNITFRRRLLISIPENSIFFGVFLYICILCFCSFAFCIFVFLFVFLSLLMGIPPLTSDVRRKQSVLIRKRHLSMPMILRWERLDLESGRISSKCNIVSQWSDGTSGIPRC